MKYYYYDNWNGKLREFKTLTGAKEAALEETGVSITIYKYGQADIYCFAPASGYTPA